MPPESRTGRRMPFGYPGRLVAEALGQDDEIDDLGRVRAARNCDADPAHSVPPLMAPPLNIRCEARLNIVRAFEQIGLELFAELGDGIFVWARVHSGGIGRLVIDISYLFDFT